MSVIGPSCRLPTENSPGCASAAPKKPGSKLAATASMMTALAAVACTACCVLPFTLPATLLALTGGSIAVLDHAHGWMTKLAIAAVAGGVAWIAWQRWKTKQPLARSTLALIFAASLLTATAAHWPRLEPMVFKTLGIAKKAPQNG